MTVTDKIIEHVNALPESAQSEVLDFVEYLELKSNKVNWSELSVTGNAGNGIRSRSLFT